jgi:hypothetical protein
VDDGINALSRIGDNSEIPKVGADQLEAWMVADRVQSTSAVQEPIQDAHAVSTGQETGHEDRPDVSGAPSNQDGSELAHPVIPIVFVAIHARPPPETDTVPAEASGNAGLPNRKISAAPGYHNYTSQVRWKIPIDTTIPYILRSL